MDDHPHKLPQIAAEPQTVSDLQISAELWRLLSVSPSDHAVRTIRQNSGLLGQVRLIAKHLRRLAEPAGDVEVVRILEPLVLVYGVSEGARSSSFWKVYIQALRDLPGSALREAVNDYASLPDSLYFPKPGQLKELAQIRSEALCKAAARAREAVEAGPLKLPPPESAQLIDERFEALTRAERLERSVPMRVRVNIPYSQWPEQHRAACAEAGELRRRYR